MSNKTKCRCCTPNVIDMDKVSAISREINEWYGIDDFYFEYNIEEDEIVFTELGSWEGVSTTDLAKFCPFCGRDIEEIKKEFQSFSKLDPKKHGHV